MPDMQAVQFQVLDMFFFAIVYDLHKLFFKSNSVCEEFILSICYCEQLEWLMLRCYCCLSNEICGYELALNLQDSDSAEVQVKKRERSVKGGKWDTFILFLWMLVQALECMF